MEHSGSDRVKNLPHYLFARIDKIIEEKKASGIDIISLGIGDPVEPTPSPIIDAHVKALMEAENHRYPSYFGLKEFRAAAASWMKKRFSVKLHPDKEILPLIGSKEGIAHLPWALVNPGEFVLVPDPGYPVYATATILAEGRPYFLPLLKENNFHVDLEAIPADVANNAKLLFLNYPNNPTSASADISFFEKIVKWALNNNVIVAHDNAYSEITFNGYVAPSILEVDRSKEVAVEFHSLSKTFNMTGWRIGFVAGNEKVIDALGRLKTNIDSGIFNPIQYAGIKALEEVDTITSKMIAIYAKRKNIVEDFLNRAGLSYWKSDATIYIWVKVPEGETSESFTSKILEKAGVVVSPGNAYGASGEGYIRISLTVKDDRLKEAIKRLEKALL